MRGKYEKVESNSLKVSITLIVCMIAQFSYQYYYLYRNSMPEPFYKYIKSSIYIYVFHISIALFIALIYKVKAKKNMKNIKQKRIYEGDMGEGNNDFFRNVYS